MKKMLSLVVLFCLLTLSACQKDIPEPETKDISSSSNVTVEASSMRIAQEDTFFVKYHVKGRDVYIECIAKNASFRNKSAKIVLLIDGKDKTEYQNAAFIVKGLQPGPHHMKLELFKENEAVAAAVKEMDILINK
ncbi:hypothetical protein [Niallia endozanthoxylica]|uniref:Lipoprotein n=1 Tax=Niallia endozanthoxylica TaxID=2036016 RepID=A0A5J5HY52_9BACI|nr:hypothetical protein [Niallia endozanthoxylica]KAA9025992.1 hypothetical protein F4V44_08915 [Niallia endozanthoxylica]